MLDPIAHPRPHCTIKHWVLTKTVTGLRLHPKAEQTFETVPELHQKVEFSYMTDK